VQSAPEHVAPDPYSIYPDIGKCTADGLKAPDGKMRKSVI
jgi:urea transport system substrate-binding protein